MSKLADALVAINSVETSKVDHKDPEEIRRDQLKANMDDMKQAMDNVTALEARHTALLNLPDDAPMKGMRLYINEKALKQAYRLMNEIARRDDSEATQDDEQAEE